MHPNPPNPLCVEIIRGSTIESFHRGRVAVVSTEGTTELAHGDINAPIYPRSAVKAFQALPTIACGATQAFNFTPQEIAIMGASHSGEPQHTETVSAMLEKMNLRESALQCGKHWPMGEAAARNLAAAGQKPTALHNNCSGKHAGMLAYCRHNDIDHKDYIHHDHPVQIKIRETIENICETDLQTAPFAKDGCSVPTWCFPLKAVAQGFAHFANPDKLPDALAQACKLLYRTITANPFMIAGSERYCSQAMQAANGRVFLKVGAEGVYCAAIPERKLGIALKCDDGATRGAEAMMTAVIRYLFNPSPQDIHSHANTIINKKNEQTPKKNEKNEKNDLQKESESVSNFFTDEKMMTNFNGYEIGKIRALNLASKGEP